MKLVRTFPGLLSGTLALLSLVTGAAEETKRQTSLGDLERFDPVPESLPGLLRVHGKPRRGFPTPAGERLQRVGNEDRWIVEVGGHLALVELGKKSGQMETKQAIVAQPEWCLSPDGTKLFARRMDMVTYKDSLEFFDLQSGKSLWTAEDKLDAADATFSLDGQQLIILHPAEGGGAVSWYDTATGKLTKRVAIPGEIYRISGALSTDYLGVTQKAVYVAVPRENDVPEGWMIPEGSEQAVKLELDDTPSEDLAQVRVGGASRELVAFYSEDVVELFREEKGGLKRLHRLEVTPPPTGSSYSKDLRFFPDHSQVLISCCNHTWIVTTKETPKPVMKEYDFGWALGDFTKDGKYVVTFDDGGGVVRSVKDMQRVDRADLQEEPEHCCPIEEAGFSMQGNYIFSNDKHNLILWKKDGTMLAELTSPNSERGREVIMQSPLIVEKLNKIYAADGWDFLEWSIDEIAERRKKLKGINPRVAGKEVYRDRKSPIDEPETMSIAIDPAGKNLVTGTRLTFIYRPLDAPEKKTEMQVPKRDIMMKPRSIHLLDGYPKVLVKSGGSMWELDQTGKEKPVALNQWFGGFDAKTRSFYRIDSNQRATVLTATPFGLGQKPQETMPLPADWARNSGGQMLVSTDGRWIVASHGVGGRTSRLAVIDWKERKVVKDFPLSWAATTLSFSPDEKRLLVGSQNRAVYEFDFADLIGSDG